MTWVITNRENELTHTKFFRRQFPELHIDVVCVNENKIFLVAQHLDKTQRDYDNEHFAIAGTLYTVDIRVLNQVWGDALFCAEDADTVCYVDHKNQAIDQRNGARVDRIETETLATFNIAYVLHPEWEHCTETPLPAAPPHILKALTPARNKNAQAWRDHSRAYYTD